MSLPPSHISPSLAIKIKHPKLSSLGTTKPLIQVQTAANQAPTNQLLSPQNLITFALAPSLSRYPNRKNLPTNLVNFLGSIVISCKYVPKLLASNVISLISVPQNSVVYVPGGYGMQAVALRISGDKAMFYGVRILGTQDTLLDDSGSHYFYRSYIQGSVDFIFGRSRSLYRVIIFYAPSYI